MIQTHVFVRQEEDGDVNMRKKMMGGGMMKRTAMKKGGKMNAGLKAYLAKKKKDKMKKAKA